MSVSKISLLATILALNLPVVYSQTTVNVNEAVVSASRVEIKSNEISKSITVITREEIEKSPVSSVNELLKYALNVDVRQRGMSGVQADLGIRGSNFSQVLILLNGIRMNDAQTGHFNMNLPIELLDVERIEILYGGASRIYGDGAFAGAINIITRNAEKSNVKAIAELGDYKWNQIGIQANIAQENHSHSLSLLHKGSDGEYRNTDFEQRNIFWQSQFKNKNGKLKINLGQNEKSFGAQNFYSVRFPYQYEKNKLQFFSAKGNYRFNKLTLTGSFYSRVHFDRFELFREGQGYYGRNADGTFRNLETNDTITWYSGHNYHKSTTIGGELNASYQSTLGTTSLGYEFRKESILSNALGMPITNSVAVKGEHPSAFYTKEDWRENHSVFVEHNLSFEKLFISAGALLNINSRFDESIYSGIDLGYQFSKRFRAYSSINKSFRFPSFTDLYYSLGGAVGSIDLKPEESINYEIGGNYKTPYLVAQAAVFIRDGKNLIDWVRFNGNDTIKAANLTEVTLYGVEASIKYSFTKWLGDNNFIQTVSLNTAFLTSDTLSTGFESNYVLDYLTTQMNLSLNFRLAEQTQLNWMIRYQERIGDYFDAAGNSNQFGSQVISDMSVSQQIKNLKLYLQISNLFDEKYIDIGNVRMPGRLFRLGIKVNL